jgi:hypothetical protein
MVISLAAPGETYHLTWKFRCNFLSGFYFIGISVLGLTGGEIVRIAGIADALVFQVIDPAKIKQGGIVLLNVQPTIRKI